MWLASGTITQIKIDGQARSGDLRWVQSQFGKITKHGKKLDPLGEPSRQMTGVGVAKYG